MNFSVRVALAPATLVAFFVGAACSSDGTATCTANCDAGTIDSGTVIVGPPGCASGKDPKDDAACITDARGVFVKQGAAGGDGTKAKPFGTIAEGIAKASGRAVFVCEGTYAESLELHGAVALYGGFDCNDFSHAGHKSFLASPTATAIKVTAGTAVVLQDWRVVAADGTTPGGTSVGLFAVNAKSVQITRSEIRAGQGQAGTPGSAGAPGQAGVAGLARVDDNGGLGGVRDCGGGQSSTGGAGGHVPNSPSQYLGGTGSSTPALYMEVEAANNGTGGNRTSPTVFENGRLGQNGAPSTDVGGAAETIGQLRETGWESTGGKAGGSGNVAQGGGGGAGGLAANPGGGGGSGGCGGAGGTGGGGGGSSFAIVALTSDVRLLDTKLITSSAGIGGTGGTGGIGGAGGAGGPADPQGYSGAGGAGGNGAGGNGGGGGSGGLSIGVLYTGKAPTIAGTTVATAATADYFSGPSATDNGGPAGEPGAAATTDGHDGNPGIAGSKGRSGTVAAVYEAK